MAETVGVGIIARNVEKTIEDCIESFIKEVDKCVVVQAGESTDKTPRILRKLQKKYNRKLELYEIPWVDDFSAARNYSFSKLDTDWIFWCDADDKIYHPEKLRELTNNVLPEVGSIWFPYHYAIDEYGNVITIYERERLFRAKYNWIWKNRVHETCSPLDECKYVRSDEVILLHDHKSGGDRGERNFKLLYKMQEEDPHDKRIWLYLGHQNFAGQNWLEASKWYLKFGTDKTVIPLERFQALCYCSKTLRLIRDPQSVDVAVMAVELFPNYTDGYLELAHSYFAMGDMDKSLHWATLSENKSLITEPPQMIFINPLDYTYNKWCLQAECYLRKGNYEKCLEYRQKAYQVCPSEPLKNAIEAVAILIKRERVANGIRALATHYLDTQELVKLRKLPDMVPFWYKDLPEYKQLSTGIGVYTKDIKNDPQIVEGENNSVTVNVANVVDVFQTIKNLDLKYSKVTVISPIPTSETKQINVLSQTDLENLVVSLGERHVLNLRREPDKFLLEFNNNIPVNLHVRFFCGQGLEYWNPQTIKELGCGGSETWAAWTAKALATMRCQPVIYATDTQVWDGVIYRHFSDYRPDNIATHLFISSRVPEVFNVPIPAKQKWLWFHDVHRWDRFTPDVASKIDALVVLSQWHANFIKATYPFMRDARVIDFDKNPLTYNDCETQGVWYADEKADRLPVMAIIGNGIDTERFESMTETRVPHRFIWCSSPDRGLKEVLDLWPLIRKEWSDAELKIFYGWEYFDSALGLPQYREFKEKLRVSLKQKGVEWCGRVGQDELAKELMKADIMLYPPPHSFRETYGIAFLEAQAAGVLCFYRMNGALGETIGDRGIPLRNDMTQEEIIQTLISTRADENACDIMRSRAREYAMGRAWKRQAEVILELYRSLDEQDNGYRGGGKESQGFNS